MNIIEMHNTFRTLGQKMGMQNIRGILPESIDVYLNDAIVEIVRQLLLYTTKSEIDSSQLQTGGNSISKASTMSALNALRSLFRNTDYSISLFSEQHHNDDYKLSSYDITEGEYIINIPTEGSNIKLDADEIYIKSMMFLGFSISYGNTSRKYNCRIVGPDDIENVINDYCNAPSRQYPVVCLYSNDIPNIVDSTYRIKIKVYTGHNSKPITSLNIDYIKFPNVVQFNNNEDYQVNCDLPEYLHYEIVERAVQKYLSSIGNGTPQQPNN